MLHKVKLAIYYLRRRTKKVYIYTPRMKKYIAIFLLLALSFNMSAKVILWTNYQANKSEITRKYCENKAKPKLKCDGKCHLKKQLQKEEGKEKNSSKNSLKESNENQFFAEYTLSQFIGHSSQFTALFHYHSLHSISHTHAVFSPPQC